MHCPLCGSEESKLVVGRPDVEHDWVRCACGLVYKGTAEPRDTASNVSHYDEEYFGRYDRRRRHRVAKARRQILDALDAQPPAGRLIDVGCSLGYTLEAARSLGLDADGIDVSVHAVEGCRSRGLSASVGSLSSIPAGDATYSVAILKHVFEHTIDPRTALAELRRVLVPRAAAFFAVPNLDYFKAKRSPATSRFFRGEAGRAHDVYYSTVTLRRLLESEGFRIISVHPRLVHRNAGGVERLMEVAILPVRIPLRAAADALGLRKEFWLVAVRS